MTDAEATVRAAILEALASNADQTGLIAGPATEQVVDAIVEGLVAPETVWATRELSG
jgi:hypothetical protein